MSSLQTLLSRILPARLLLPNTPPQQPVSPTTLAAAAAATLVLVPLFTYWTRCYLAWHSLGGGGLPNNPLGWLVNLAMHLCARTDHRCPRAPYADRLAALTAPDGRYGPAGAKSFFSLSPHHHQNPDLPPPPPPRPGPRPAVPTTIAPQRQTTQRAPARILALQASFLRALAAANPGLLALRPSALESPAYDALWLDASSPNPKLKLKLPAWFHFRAPGEIAHVHPEGSTHVVMSLVDGARVVERGRGERHRLTGGGRMALPWGYVLVYAPREGEGEEEEMRVWRECVVAGARFVAESAGAGDGVEVVVVPDA